MKFFIVLILAFVLTSIARADEFNVLDDLGRCSSLMKNLSTSRNLDAMAECMDFYFGHGSYESPPHSFNNTIAIGKRWVEVDAKAEAVYTQVAWLLYSKWATWNSTPQDMPDGEPCAKQMVEILERGAVANPMSSAYFMDAGHTLFPLAQHYMPEYYPTTERYYSRVDQLTSDSNSKIRARLNIGHIHRLQGHKEIAIAWYKRVLEIDPQEPVALRYIKKLEAQPI